MSYYTDVYLRKLNRFGNTLQERIVNKKEYEFNNFVKKSPNRVVVYDQDKKFEGILQSKTYNEIETVNYFLTYKSILISGGTILKIADIKDSNNFTYWIVVCKDNLVSCGYDRYTVIKLDREIRWITKEGYLFKALVHISGAGANARDKRITNSYKINNESISYLPTQTLTITMKDSPQIKRGIRINIKNKIWRISGVENISNDGVCYVTLEQDYEDELRDKTTHVDNELDGTEGIADGYKLGRWDFYCSLDNGEQVEYKDKIYPLIKLNIDETGTPVDFSPYYFDVEDNSELIINIHNNYKAKYENRTLYGLRDGETILTVALKNSPDIKKDYLIKVTKQKTNYFNIDAPSRLKMCQQHKIYCNMPFYIKDIIPSNDKNNINISNIMKDEKGYYRTINVNKIINQLEIVFSNMENNDLNVETEQTYKKIFNIESLWMGGI